MAIQKWSASITVVELGDDPLFSEDMAAMMDSLAAGPTDVVLNFVSVSYINSSNLAKLLKLRKAVLSGKRRLLLCCVHTQVWGVFLVTGLDKLFECTSDISTALATIQLVNG